MTMVCGVLFDEAGVGNCSTQPGENCEGCGGTGIRFPAEPSCVLRHVPSGWIVVERCDYCQRYADDLTAAHIVCEHAEWVRCESGGLHAVGHVATV